MAQADQSEIDRLQAELEALRSRVGTERAQRNQRTRRIATRVLVVIAVLVTTLALLSIWTFRTMTNTELFVDRVGSIIEEPEVAAAIGNAAATQLVVATDLATKLEATLPPQLQILATPITSATQDFLAKGATALVGTDAFLRVWDAALTASHKVSIAILSGKDTAAVSNENGVIVLDLAPVVNELIAQSSDLLSGVLNRDVGAPTVTSDQLTSAIDAINQRLGTDLSTESTTITIFASDDLAQAQQWYQVIRTSVWLAPLIALILIGLALAVSLRRGRTALILVVGVAVSLVVVAIALEPLKSTLLDAVASPTASSAVAAAFDKTISSLLTGIAVIGALGAIAAIILLIASRAGGEGATRDAVVQVSGLASQHKGLFLGGGAIFALVLLALVPGRTWGQLLVVGALYAAFAGAVLMAHRAAPLSASDAPIPGEVRPVA